MSCALFAVRCGSILPDRRDLGNAGGIVGGIRVACGRLKLDPVTESVGLCKRRGGPTEVIRPGDRVLFEPGEEHWHGATPKRFMTHLAMLQVDDEGKNASWGAHVTDEEYN